MELELENDFLIFISNSLVINICGKLVGEICMRNRIFILLLKYVFIRFLFIKKRKIVFRVEIVIRYYVNEIIKV